MRFVRGVSDSDRRPWFAADDADLAPLARSTSSGNGPGPVLFEIGLVIAIPLTIAGSISIVFGV